MEELQSILEKINREGVEKADAEAKRIVDEARAAAAKAKAEADAESADAARRGEETLRQIARDVVIGVGDAVTALLENLLARDVDKALADEATATALVAAAIKDLTGPGEITAGAKLADALRAQLAAKKDFTVVTDEATGTGFSVRLDGGRIEHAFTGAVIAEELAKCLRPELAKLLKG